MDCTTPQTKGPNFATTMSNINKCLSKAKSLRSDLDYLRNGNSSPEPDCKEKDDSTPNIGTLDTTSNDCVNVLSECQQLMNELRG